MTEDLRSIDAITAAAMQLFRSDSELTTWDAVDRVLDKIDPRQLAAIYRRESQSQPWCREALQAGGDYLYAAGIENIAAVMRMDREVYRADRLRIDGSAAFSRSPTTRRPRRRR